MTIPPNIKPTGDIPSNNLHEAEPPLQGSPDHDYDLSKQHGGVDFIDISDSMDSLEMLIRYAEQQPIKVTATEGTYYAIHSPEATPEEVENAWSYFDADDDDDEMEDNAEIERETFRQEQDSDPNDPDAPTPDDIIKGLEKGEGFTPGGTQMRINKVTRSSTDASNGMPIYDVDFFDEHEHEDTTADIIWDPSTGEAWFVSQ